MLTKGRRAWFKNWLPYIYKYNFEIYREGMKVFAHNSLVIQAISVDQIYYGLLVDLPGSFLIDTTNNHTCTIRGQG